MAPRRHWMMGVIVCLVLGAVVSLAVAAACAVWFEQIEYLRASRGSDPDVTLNFRFSAGVWVEDRAASQEIGARMDVLARLRDEHLPRRREERLPRAAEGMASAEFYWSCCGIGGSSEFLVERVGRKSLLLRSGWPWRCLSAIGTSRWESPMFWKSAVEIPSWLRPARRGNLVPVLPLNIQWGGLALNTLVFGGLLWGASFGWRHARTWRRRRRGCCLGCGYSLDGLAGKCPECGEG